MHENEPYFVGKDVAEVLGYKQPTHALRNHIKEQHKTVCKTYTVNGTAPILIDEAGVYCLVMRSKLPSAEDFQEWVTSEVLPAIRKHGGYLTKEKIEEVLFNPDTLIELALKLKNEQQKVQRLEADKACLKVCKG